MMTRRLFHINVTRQCQLACSHCYIDQAIRDNTQVMSTNTLQEIAHIIGDTHADIHIIGGEPTLLSIETHKKYLSILSKLKNSKIMLVTALQNTRALKVAGLYQNIATSYDPGVRTEINNNKINNNKINKINNNNNNNNNKINININNKINKINTNKWLARCKELTEQGHHLNVCITLSHSVIDYGVSKVLDELYQHGFRTVHLSAMVPTSNALNQTPDPLITSKAMIESAQWVLEKRKNNKDNIKQNIFVSPFDGLAQDMSHYEGLSCAAGQQCVNIEPNGQIHACVAKGGEVSDEVSSQFNGEVRGRVNGNLSSDVNGNLSNEVNDNLSDDLSAKIKDMNNAQVLPIKQQLNSHQTLSVKQQLNSNAYRLAVAQHNRTRAQCMGCEFWQICKGGCQVLANTEIAKQSPECAGYKTFLNYVKEQIS